MEGRKGRWPHFPGKSKVMSVSDTEIFRLIANAGPVVRLILALLLIFSIACWAIIFTKWVQIRRARAQTAVFIEYFWKSADLSKAFSRAKDLTSSPVARAYRTAYMEMSRVMAAPSRDAGMSNEGSRGNWNIQITGRDNIERALRRAIQAELIRLTQYVPFLATAGNTAPFIGLFGTVWGIMNAFHGIGQRGSASLAVVAPGISEALVATAAGLAAAIPAVIFYNHFMTKIRIIEAEMRNFSADFLNIVEREILGRKGA